MLPALPCSVRQTLASASGGFTLSFGGRVSNTLSIQRSLGAMPLKFYPQFMIHGTARRQGPPEVTLPRYYMLQSCASVAVCQVRTPWVACRMSEQRRVSVPRRKMDVGGASISGLPWACIYLMLHPEPEIADTGLWMCNPCRV
jgi:hypothetical protein